MTLRELGWLLTAPVAPEVRVVLTADAPRLRANDLWLLPSAAQPQLVLHDDGAREYAYGPARGLPETRVGTFTAGLDDEARSRGWFVISMKTDWKRVFSFEN